MQIEPVNAAAMAYQGSASTVELKSVAEKPEMQTLTMEAPETTEKVHSSSESANAQEDKKQGQEKQDGQIRKAVEDINKNYQQTEAIFGIHEGTNRITIKIVDRQSRKVVKEYPPEKTLDMIEKVWEMAGLMVDEKR